VTHDPKTEGSNPTTGTLREIRKENSRVIQTNKQMSKQTNKQMNKQTKKQMNKEMNE
jgi:hypothetical protein